VEPKDVIVAFWRTCSRTHLFGIDTVSVSLAENVFNDSVAFTERQITIGNRGETPIGDIALYFGGALRSDVRG
jgi:hypothetical protein